MTIAAAMPNNRLIGDSLQIASETATLIEQPVARHSTEPSAMR